jgi:hypothetical protein
VQTGSWAYPASRPVSTRGPFPGGKARPRLASDGSPSSSAEVKNEKELCHLSPLVPAWRSVTGFFYTTIVCSPKFEFISAFVSLGKPFMFIIDWMINQWKFLIVKRMPMFK